MQSGFTLTHLGYKGTIVSWGLALRNSSLSHDTLGVDVVVEDHARRNRC
jgi:hypothetical protein